MRQKVRQLNIRWMALVLAVLLLALSAPFALAAETGGDCGDLKWTLSAGTLTLEGSGVIPDYTEDEMPPWYEHRAEVLRLSLPEGLTAVGELAFYDCMNLQTVSIPASVKRIGDYAFASCEGLVMLGLGSGLRDIGTDAFYGCWALSSARLPNGLETIGSEAFYDCRSLTSVTIPASVTSVGSAAFAYCTSLVRAEVKSELTALPDWTFFGCSALSTVILPKTIDSLGNAAFRDCDNLSTVSYGGDSVTMEELKKEIAADAPAFGGTGSMTDDAPAGAASSGTAQENPDGTVTEKSTSVVESENATVSADITHTHDQNTLAGGELSSEITAVVDGEDGWDEALEGVQQALDEVSSRTQADTTVKTTDINVYATGSDRVAAKFVDALAGRDVTLTVTNQNGSKWKIDCSQLGGGDSSEDDGKYDLSCTLYNAPAEIYGQLGAETVFLLRFNTSAQVNAEVLVALGGSYARRNATLFKQDGGELVRYQTVVTDGSGFAHFYLASVTNEADYYIAMDLAPENDDAIIPDELLAEYGEGAVRYDPIQYEITGRTSSWGMNIRQVTWIMVGVLVVVVAAVGVTMFLLNKRKLKMGYVPDLGDEEDA